MKHDSSTTSDGMLDRLVFGAAAGLTAAAATSLFQAAWRELRLPPKQKPPAQPVPTDKLAEEATRIVAHRSLTEAERHRGGLLIHHAIGAAIGMIYAVGSRSRPSWRAARGVAFGLAVWAGLEEAGLALVGLKPPPWRVKLIEHLFGVASHVVFGLALDAALGVRPGDRRRETG